MRDNARLVIWNLTTSPIYPLKARRPAGRAAIDRYCKHTSTCSCITKTKASGPSLPSAPQRAAPQTRHPSGSQKSQVGAATWARYFAKQWALRAQWSFSHPPPSQTKGKTHCNRSKKGGVGGGGRLCLFCYDLSPADRANLLRHGRASFQPTACRKGAGGERGTAVLGQALEVGFCHVDGRIDRLEGGR